VALAETTVRKKEETNAAESSKGDLGGSSLSLKRHGEGFLVPDRSLGEGGIPQKEIVKSGAKTEPC